MRRDAERMVFRRNKINAIRRRRVMKKIRAGFERVSVRSIRGGHRRLNRLLIKRMSEAIRREVDRDILSRIARVG